MLPNTTPLHLRSLTGLRFVAALAVFLYHDSEITKAVPALRVLHTGFVGVTFFFILSGFVLTWSAPTVLKRRTFWRRRFARIYPLHFLTWFAAIGLLVALNRAINLRDTLLGLLLLQVWWPNETTFFSNNGVAWSLACEAFFYLCFPFLLALLRALTPRHRWMVVGAYCSLSGAAAGLALTYGGFVDATLYVNPLLRMNEFTLGMALAIELQRGWRPGRVRVSELGLVGCLVAAAAAAAVTVDTPLRALTDALLIVPFGWVILRSAGRDIAGMTSWLSGRALVYLGEVSFAFYLVHDMIVTWFQHLWPVPSHAPASVYAGRMLAVLLVSLGVSIAAHEWFEEPARRRLSHGRRVARTQAGAVEALP